MVIDLHNKIRLGFSLNLIVWKMKWEKTGCILNGRILSEGVWRMGDNFEKCFFIQKISNDILISVSCNNTCLTCAVCTHTYISSKNFDSESRCQSIQAINLKFNKYSMNQVDFAFNVCSFYEY